MCSVILTPVSDSDNNYNLSKSIIFGMVYQYVFFIWFLILYTFMYYFSLPESEFRIIAVFIEHTVLWSFFTKLKSHIFIYVHFQLPLFQLFIFQNFGKLVSKPSWCFSSVIYLIVYPSNFSSQFNLHLVSVCNLD